MKRSQVYERLEDINDRAEAYESDAARRKRNWPYTYAPEAERPFQFRSHTITSLGDVAVRCDARWVRRDVREAARRRRGPGGVPREDVVRLTPCSELGRRPRQKLPVVALLLPVHQDVQVLRGFLAVGKFLLADKVEAHNGRRPDDADRGVLVFE